MQREQRGSRHAVLQAGPRRPPQRLRADRHSLLEPTDPSPERQNLPPGEPDSRVHRPARAYSARTLGTPARTRRSDGAIGTRLSGAAQQVGSRDFEVLAHERDRHAAFADGRGDALHWAGPNIAAREDAWNARFEEVRVEVEVPSPRGRDVGTGEYVAVAIKCDLLRQPRRLRVR